MPAFNRGGAARCDGVKMAEVGRYKSLEILSGYARNHELFRDHANRRSGRWVTSEARAQHSLNAKAGENRCGKAPRQHDALKQTGVVLRHRPVRQGKRSSRDIPDQRGQRAGCRAETGDCLSRSALTHSWWLRTAIR